MIATPSSLAGRKRTTRVIDINHNNPITPQSLRAAGIQGVIYKISQGTYPDPEAANFHKICVGLGLLEGGYCFSEPGNGAEQAKFFFASVLRALNGQWPGPQFPLCLDLEPAKRGKMTIPQAEDFVNYIIDKTGYAPLLYGGGGLLRDAMEYDNRFANTSLRRCRLWLADPRTNWRVIKGWETFALRQSAEDHEAPGWDYDEIVCPDGYAGTPEQFLGEEWPRLMVKI